jgi:hypothetical protein
LAMSTICAYLAAMRFGVAHKVLHSTHVAGVEVQGSQPQPYGVSIQLRAYGKREWRKVAGQRDALRRLPGPVVSASDRIPGSASRQCGRVLDVRLRSSSGRWSVLLPGRAVELGDAIANGARRSR